MSVSSTGYQNIVVLWPFGIRKLRPLSYRPCRSPRSRSLFRVPSLFGFQKPSLLLVYLDKAFNPPIHCPTASRSLALVVGRRVNKAKSTCGTLEKPHTHVPFEIRKSWLGKRRQTLPAPAWSDLPAPAWSYQLVVPTGIMPWGQKSCEFPLFVDEPFHCPMILGLLSLSAARQRRNLVTFFDIAFHFGASFIPSDSESDFVLYRPHCAVRLQHVVEWN